MDALTTRLFPAPAAQLPLVGLYLRHDLRGRAPPGNPYIYSNFVLSLDGRISQPNPTTGRRPPPAAVRHPHDWHLYLELAAQADAVLISGRRLRELCASGSSSIECVADISHGDLAQWRLARGLPPQPACLVLSTSLDFPVDELGPRRGGDMVVISGNQVSAERVRCLSAAGIDVVITSTARPSGHDVYRVACERRYGTVYSIAGPEVLHTLLAANRLDRLYLTFALRVIAGLDYDTLVHGPWLTPPFSADLHELYFDPPLEDYPGLLLTSLDRSIRAGPLHSTNGDRLY